MLGVWKNTPKISKKILKLEEEKHKGRVQKKNWEKAVRLRGGDPPSPPKAVSLTAFSQFFF